MFHLACVLLRVMSLGVYVLRFHHRRVTILKHIRKALQILKQNHIHQDRQRNILAAPQPVKNPQLTGKNSPVLLWEDIVSTYRDGGEVLLCGLDETAWDDYTDDFQRIIGEYKKHGISWRALMREGDTHFSTNIDVNIEKNYRWIPKELFTQLPYYVYKDKLAFVLWGSPMRVVILTHAIIAETFKRQFEINWKNAKMPKRK
jgi:hypothetical protein